MRILVAGAHRVVVGGAESYQRSLVEALLSRGQPVALLHEYPLPRGRPALDAGAPGLPTWCAAELGVEGALSQAARWGADVVYTHGLRSPRLERRLVDRWPAVLFAHDYHGTCESGTKRHAFPRLAFCNRRFGPACLLLHYPRRCGGLNPATALRLYRLQAARNALLPRYRGVCVASQHMALEYRRHHVPEGSLHVLPLPPSGVVPDPEPPLPHGPTGRLLMMGRLTPIKGGALLLQAMSRAAPRLPLRLSLLVVGDGPERERLEAGARRLELAVSFRSWVGVDERNAILRAADLLALPSIWPEPWGLSGLEAACVGVPTVGFASGGIPEWVVAGESGELAPAEPPTPGGLAEALVRALASADHYAKLRQGAWRQARRYTMDSHLDQLLNVLEAARGTGSKG